MDQQFIAKGVTLVVHVGDMVNDVSQVNDYTRALYAQDLYNDNNTPRDITTALIPDPNLDPIAGNPPADKTNLDGPWRC